MAKIEGCEEAKRKKRAIVQCECNKVVGRVETTLYRWSWVGNPTTATLRLKTSALLCTTLPQYNFGII